MIIRFIWTGLEMISNVGKKAGDVQQENNEKDFEIHFFLFFWHISQYF